MITKENWKNYVSYQPDSMKNEDTAMIFYMYTKQAERQGEITNISVAVERELIPVTNITLTEDELVEQINQSFNSFTHRVNIREGEEGKVDLIQAGNEIAKRSLRGSANTNIGNVWFYKGTSGMDAPLFVTSCEDKYYLFKHPNFDNYGFIVESDNRDK